MAYLTTQELMIELGGMFNSLKIYHKRFKKKTKKKVSKERTARRKRLERNARKLRANPPKSEVWFQALYKPYKDDHDHYNYPLDLYIPDVQNIRYRYIIEVDGSYHNIPKQQIRDKKKDRHFALNGYKVIRIKAYDLNSFEQGLKTVLQLRNAGLVLDDNTAASASLVRKDNASQIEILTTD